MAKVGFLHYLEFNCESILGMFVIEIAEHHLQLPRCNAYPEPLRPDEFDEIFMISSSSKGPNFDFSHQASLLEVDVV